jgi:hypothetical protein
MTMTATRPRSIPITARDVTRQKAVNIPELPTDATVSELIDVLVPRLKLATTDGSGSPVNYYARNDRTGDHLHGADLVSESLQADDEISLSPEVTAG